MYTQASNKRGDIDPVWPIVVGAIDLVASVDLILLISPILLILSVLLISPILADLADPSWSRRCEWSSDLSGGGETLGTPEVHDRDGQAIR